MGGHGAGLTNLIYSMPNSFVGEIRFDGVPPAYLVMSRQLGMRFSRFKANIVAVERGQVDMQVDAAAFRKWIGDCLDSLKNAGSQSEGNNQRSRISEPRSPQQTEPLFKTQMNLLQRVKQRLLRLSVAPGLLMASFLFTNWRRRNPGSPSIWS